MAVTAARWRRPDPGATGRIPAGIHPKSGRRLQFMLPSGQRMPRQAGKEQGGNSPRPFNPGGLPDEGVIRSFRINRPLHALLGGVDSDASARLFREVFDFGLSEPPGGGGQSGQSLALFLTGSTATGVTCVLAPRGQG